MKKIICYGDSNTYGFNPENGKRFDENSRWSEILKNKLSNTYEVIEKGLNNRTAFIDNSNGVEFSTNLHLPKILENYKDIEYLILSVGVNDFQFQYDLSIETLKKELENLLKTIISKNIKAIIIKPVKLDENIFNGYFSCLFNEKSIEKSKELTDIYFEVSKKLNCICVNLDNITKPSKIDGLHYDKNSHKLIAQHLKELLIS